MKASSRSRLTVVLLGLLAFVATSCGGNRILIEPPANKVKKLALVSVNAQRGVRNMSGGGGLTQGLSALSSMTKGSGDATGGADFGGTKLVAHALATFESEIGNVPGWQVQPASQTIGTPAYAQFAATAKSNVGGLMGSLSNMTQIGAEGMVVLPEAAKFDYRGGLAELARNLDVDAVAVISMDVAYRPSTAVMGTGTASAMVGIGLVVVTRDGEYAVNVPPERSSYRVSSSETAALVAGNLMWTDAAERAFRESVGRGMAKIREDILYDLQQKK